MNPAKYTIDDFTFGFSLDAVRRNYPKKDDFVNDTLKGHPGVDKVKLKKVLNKVWNEAFPQTETN